MSMDSISTFLVIASLAGPAALVAGALVHLVAERQRRQMRQEAYWARGGEHLNTDTFEALKRTPSWQRSGRLALLGIGLIVFGAVLVLIDLTIFLAR